MALTCTPRVQEIREELRLISAARQDLLESGQSVSISGSHSVTRVKMEELNKRETALKRELLAIARPGYQNERKVPFYEPQNR